MEEVDEIVADNDSEHDEILDDAAITYKTHSKDRKRVIRKRAERLEIVKGELRNFSKKERKAENQTHH